MVSVKVQPGESADSAYRKLSKKVAEEGILQELKVKERYIKPSQRRKFQEQIERRKKKRAR